MTQTARLNVYLRNPDLTRGLLIDNYRSLKFSKKFNDIGKFSMEIDGKSAAALAIRNGTRYGILVRRNNKTLFAGEIEHYGRKIDETGNDVFTVSGSDDNVWLARRIVYPTPGNDYQVVTGDAETVMRNLVEQRLGAGAGSPSSIGLVNPASTGIGWSSSIAAARYTNLLELLQGLAGLFTGFPVRFNIDYDDTTHTRTFTVAYIRNRAASIIFGLTYGNIAGFDYGVDVPEATAWAIGCDGDGAARFILSGGNLTDMANWGYIETFVDRRDADTTSKRTQANQEYTAEAAERTSIELNPLEFEGDNVPTYGVDYEVGDKVAIEIDGVRFFQYVTAVEVDASGQSLRIKPLLGTLSNMNAKTPNIFKEVRRLKSYTAALQARK